MIENIPNIGFSIKLTSLEFSNFKCVSGGRVEIFFEPEKKSQVLGVYGQNASGKTTLINVLAFLRLLMCGASIKDAGNYIKVGEDEARIKAEFKIEIPSKIIHFEYEVQIVKSQTNGWQIRDEKTEAYDVQNPRSRMTFNYNSEEPQSIVVPTSFRSKLTSFLDSKNPNISSNIPGQLFFLMQKEYSNHYNTSYIFSDNMLALHTLYADSNPESICDYVLLMNRFSLNRFFVITDDFINSHITGDCSIPIVLPNQGLDSQGTMKYFSLNMNKPVLAKAKKEEDINTIFLNRINNLLSVMSPGTVLSAQKAYESNDPEKQGIYFKIFSKKGENKLPLEYESLGVKKLISLASILSFTYCNHSVVLAIDEFDTSINEYLLDTYLSVFKEYGEGQLIFTSNSLHPLEVLEKEQCCFTTTNAKNAYTHLKYVKPNNNLRDLYRNLIKNGGDEKNPDLFRVISADSMKDMFDRLVREDEGRIDN